MTHEPRETRAQFLNGLAVAAVTLAVTHYLSEHNGWSIFVGLLAAAALHGLALFAARH